MNASAGPHGSPTGDTTAEARRRLAVVAGHSGDADTARELLEDADADVRAAALGALARCGALTSQVATAALADTAAAVRARLADLLAAPHVPTDDGSGDLLAAALEALLRDDEPTVVEPAAFAAGERYGMDTGIEPPPPVADALRQVAASHDDLLCRESAVAALGSWARAQDLDVLLEATTGKPALRRRAAVVLAAHLDDERAVAALRRLSEDRDWQVREVSEVLLDGIDPPGPEPLTP